MDEEKKNLNLRTCMRCRGLFVYSGIGHAICPRCREAEAREFSWVKNYVYANPGATMIEVEEATGVPIHQITEYLKAGRLEIPNNSPIFIKCEKCGQDIRSGRFCSECAHKLSAKLRKELEFDEFQIGEKPTRPSGGKMRFLGKESK